MQSLKNMIIFGVVITIFKAMPQVIKPCGDCLGKKLEILMFRLHNYHAFSLCNIVDLS